MIERAFILRIEGATIRNQTQERSLLREVNERIRELNATFGVERNPRRIDVLCECGEAACLERVEVPLAIYEQVRDGEDYFLVIPGHENGELVLAAEKTYRIVLLQGVMPELIQEAS